MPTRDTFSMPLIIVPQVVFPGIVSTVVVRPPAAGAPARVAAVKDHSLVFSLARPDHQPSNTGTSGRILDLDEVSDGWQITVAGIQRAQLLQWRHQGQSLVGQFRYTHDAEESIPPLLAEEAWALASELWAMLSLATSATALPKAAPLLSYWIAAHVPLNAQTQQELLEIPSTRGRLAKEISLMRTLLDGLRAEHSN